LEGKLRWKTKLNGKVRSSSPCLSDEKELIFIGTHNGGIYCLSQSDGSIRWDKQMTKPVLSSAAVLKDAVFFASSDRKMYSFDCTSGSKIWEFETADRIWSSPAVTEYSNVLFFGSLDSHIYGLDISTGIQTWKFPTMNMIDSSPCIASNMLFIGGRDGLLYAFGPQDFAYIK
jgi:outer membrane protein assembly factor BamB